MKYYYLYLFLLNRKKNISRFFNIREIIIHKVFIYFVLPFAYTILGSFDFFYILLKFYIRIKLEFFAYYNKIIIRINIDRNSVLINSSNLLDLKRLEKHYRIFIY